MKIHIPQVATVAFTSKTSTSTVENLLFGKCFSSPGFVTPPSRAGGFIPFAITPGQSNGEVNVS